MTRSKGKALFGLSTEDRAKASEIRYMRRWVDVPWLLGEGELHRRQRRKAGIPDSSVAGFKYEWFIPKDIALYLLDGSDKAERLEASSRKRPLKSYSGRSEVWKESALSPRWPVPAPGSGKYES